VQKNASMEQGGRYLAILRGPVLCANIQEISECMEIEAKDEAQIKTLRQAVHFWENPEYSEQQAGVRKIYHYKA